MPDVRFITTEEVARTLDTGLAIDVLERAFSDQARGEAENMPRAHLELGDAILHAVGGRVGDVTGTKTWVYTPNGAEPVLVLFSLEHGRLLAIVEAFALGQLRTSAVAGLATKLLARADARTLALLGTGRQAFSQARAVACVRELEQIRCFGRDPRRRADLAARLERELGVAVEQFDDPDRAAAGADIVTTITRAAEPVLHAGGVSPGAHVNAMGSIVPTRRELDADVVALADLVVVDSREQAARDAGELLAAERAGVLDAAKVRSLAELAGGERPPRGADEITLFKSLGVGLADVALGAEVLRRAPQPLVQATTYISEGADGPCLIKQCASTTPTDGRIRRS
jgi:alanine dehydrogenase